MKDKLRNIVGWLDEQYNQHSENYDIFTGAKPGVVRYDEHTAISFWACGAIVCIGSILYFIKEDDGNWFLSDSASQSSFSIGWAKSFSKALELLIEYTKENGKPVYYSGTDIVCHYSL